MIKLPKYKVSLEISHNTFKTYHEDIKEHIESRDNILTDKEMNKRCIEADSLWEIQWYPNTPIGFQHVYAPTLEEALELANA